MVYYNTTNLKRDELKTSQKKTISQEQKILEIFKNHQIPLSPTDIFSNFFKKTPLTSIRRALSNLTKDGKLEHCWKLK